MQPLSIAILHYSCPPVVGGVESVIAHHARLMSEAGHAVTLIAARGEQWDERIPVELRPLIDSRHADVLAVKRRLDQGEIPPAFDELVQAIEADLRPLLRRYDILIPHNVCSLNKNLALTAALHRLHGEAARPKFILWHHDLAWTTPRYRPELHDGYPWDLLRTDWPGAVHVVVSEPRRRELAALVGLAPERIHVVPSGLDAPTLLKLEPLTQTLVSQLHLLEAQPLLLTPVRITTRKNLELGLHILAEVRHSLPRARLVVTGPLGPHNPANREYFARLLKLRADLGLEGAAHFLAELCEDYLPNSVISDFYRLSDALLFPSREEGFGIPMLEAGLARLPIFCADIPPLRELGGGEATYFSPEADPRVAAAAVAERLQADRQYRLAERMRGDYLWPSVYAKRIAPLLHP